MNPFTLDIFYFLCLIYAVEFLFLDLWCCYMLFMLNSYWITIGFYLMLLGKFLNLKIYLNLLLCGFGYPKTRNLYGYYPHPNPHIFCRSRCKSIYQNFNPDLDPNFAILNFSMRAQLKNCDNCVVTNIYNTLYIVKFISIWIVWCS